MRFFNSSDELILGLKLLNHGFNLHKKPGAEEFHIIASMVDTASLEVY